MIRKRPGNHPVTLSTQDTFKLSGLQRKQKLIWKHQERQTINVTMKSVTAFGPSTATPYPTGNHFASVLVFIKLLCGVCVGKWCFAQRHSRVQRMLCFKFRWLIQSIISPFSLFASKLLKAAVFIQAAEVTMQNKGRESKQTVCLFFFFAARTY